MGRAPIGSGRAPREAVMRIGRQDEVEGILGASAMGRGVGQWADNLQKLEQRARPAMRHDHRQGMGMLRAHMGKLDVEPVDRGDELRQGIELGFALAPIVASAPILDQGLEPGQRNALRSVVDRFLVRPAGQRDTAAQVVDRLLRDVDAEGPDRRGISRRCGMSHAGKERADSSGRRRASQQMPAGRM